MRPTLKMVYDKVRGDNSDCSYSRRKTARGGGVGKIISRESGGENGGKSSKVDFRLFCFSRIRVFKKTLFHRSFFSPEAIVGWRRVYDVHRGKGKEKKHKKKKMSFSGGEKDFLKEFQGKH